MCVIVRRVYGYLFALSKLSFAKVQTAQRVEALRDIFMKSSQRRCAHTQRVPSQLLRKSKLTTCGIQRREVVLGLGGVWMRGSARKLCCAE